MRRLLLVVLVVSLLAGCGPGGGSTRELILVAGAWFGAIHRDDLARLPAFDANAPHAAGPDLTEWKMKVETLLRQYDEEKVSGQWQPDPTGYKLVKATLVGAEPGADWGVPAREGPVAAPVLTVRVTFGYDDVPAQHLSKGTKIYVQGFPIGRVYRLEIGGAEQPEVDLLDSIDIKVYLQRDDAMPKNLPPYRVLRAQYVDNSAKHRRVKWVY